MGFFDFLNKKVRDDRTQLRALFDDIGEDQMAKCIVAYLLLMNTVNENNGDFNQLTQRWCQFLREEFDAIYSAIYYSGVEYPCLKEVIAGIPPSSYQGACLECSPFDLDDLQLPMRIIIGQIDQGGETAARLSCKIVSLIFELYKAGLFFHPQLPDGSTSGITKDGFEGCKNSLRLMQLQSEIFSNNVAMQRFSNAVNQTFFN